MEMGRDLPASEEPGRVCEGMEANTKFEAENEDARRMERRDERAKGRGISDF